MTPQDTAQALALIQVYDNRTVDELTIKAWHKLLWKYTLQDVTAAVEQFFETETTYLKPADIIGRVKRIRARRLETFGGVHLNYDDEFDDEGERLPDADQRTTYLLELVKSGAIQPNTYKAYKQQQLELHQLQADVPLKQLDQ